MATIPINGLDVELTIIGADGAAVNEPVQEPERVLLFRLDAALRAHPDFQRSYPSARLVRIDSMRGVRDTGKERFYLRYQYGAQTTEFWGHVGTTAHVDCAKGIVSVTA